MPPESSFKSSTLGSYSQCLPSPPPTNPLALAPQIPGLGKPITSVDVTYDGAYILATTDDYVMVVKTTYVDPTTGRWAGGGSRGAQAGFAQRAVPATAASLPSGSHPPALTHTPGSAQIFLPPPPFLQTSHPLAQTSHPLRANFTPREANGFQDRAGGKLTTPRLLRLRPEDVVLTGGRPMRSAKFTWVRARGQGRCVGRLLGWAVGVCSALKGGRPIGGVPSWPTGAALGGRPPRRHSSHSTL